MNHHALQPAIYQPLDIATQEIRLLKIKGTRKSKSHIVNLLKSKRARFANFLENEVPDLRRLSDLIQCKCSLETFKLHDAPGYNALSYTWGDPGQSGYINVDGHTVSVGRSLLNALHRLRRDFWLDYLWVDALCINQNDDEEKTHQVPLMNQIYANAQFVYIWLGEELSLTAQAFSFIEKSASAQMHVRERQDEIYGGGQDHSPDPEQKAELARWRLEKIHSLNSEADSKLAIQQLFENPYWSRIWVLQEVVTTPDARIVCGPKKTKLSALMVAVEFWEAAHSLLINVNEYSALGYDFSVFDNFRRIVCGSPYHMTQLPEHHAKLTLIEKARNMDLIPAHSDVFRTFVRTRQFKATDDRDKIYALLNLLPSDDTFLKPDYSRSEAALYRDLIVDGIRHYKSLFCITMGGVGIFQESQSTKPPSWIPDFRRIGDTTNSYSIPIFMTGYGTRSAVNACKYKAPEYSFSSEDERILQAKGFLCDKIRLVVDDTETDLITSILLALKTQLSSSDDQENIHSELFNTFFPRDLFLNRDHVPSNVYFADMQQVRRVLASGMMLYIGELFLHYSPQPKVNRINAERRRQGLEKFTPLEEYEVVLLQGDAAISYFAVTHSVEHEMNQSKDICDRLYKQAVDAFGDKYPDEIPLPLHERHETESAAAVGRFIGAMREVWSYRNFVITERGCMGFARPGTRIGDDVCILHGCPVPLIVRPDESEYVIVGDCYLRGMMQGEMVMRQEEGEFPLENFRFK